MKTQKQITLLGLMLFTFSVLFLSCKNNDEPKKQEDKNEIVGTWKLKAASPQKAGSIIPALTSLPAIAPCYLDLKFVFKSDNMATLSGCDPATSALNVLGYLKVGSDTKWKVDNNILKLKTDGAEQSFDITQNGGNMTMVVVTDASNKDLNVLLTFARQ